MSGFINLDGYNGTPFNLYEDLNVKSNKFNNLTGTFSKSNVSDLYFSESNLDYLQEQIITQIYKITSGKHKIGRQSETELLIIMRSIFLQYCKNNNNNLEEQISDLNKKVLDYCIDNIHSTLKQQEKYIHDITTEQQVMDMPQFVHAKGDKTLMPNHFF